MAVLALAQGGCTMLNFCTGDGPMGREELGDWLGLAPKPAPEPEALAKTVADLKAMEHAGFSGRFSLPGDAGVFAIKLYFLTDIPFTPSASLMVKGRRNPWAIFVPGSQKGQWLYFDPKRPTMRSFYAAQDQWDFLVVWSDRADAYDVATRERVAVRRTDEVGGLGMGWFRLREVAPVDEYGEQGVHPLANPKVDPAKVKYLVRDGTTLLFGLIGWGRVNHERYIQLLWIPIAVGKAGPG